MSLRRKHLSKTLRFEVLKRDGFTCQYCGAKPEESALTVDHIKPIDQGGRDEASNLVTACAACNRGKSNTPTDEQQLPPIAGPQDPGSLRGPYWDKRHDRWELKWTENGEARAFTSADRSVVASKRAEMSGATAAGPGSVMDLPPMRSFSSAEDIRAGLEQAALAANRATVAGNVEALLTLKKYAALLSEIGGAIVPHTNYAETEEELAEATAELERIRTGRAMDDAQKPTAIASPATTLKGRAGPDAKPHRSRDPVPN